MFGVNSLGLVFFQQIAQTNVIKDFFKNELFLEERQHRFNHLKKSLYFFSDLTILFNELNPLFIESLDYLEKEEVAAFNKTITIMKGEKSFSHNLCALIQKNPHKLKTISQKFSADVLENVLDLLFDDHDYRTLSFLLPLVAEHSYFSSYFKTYLFQSTYLADLMVFLTNIHTLNDEQLLAEIMEPLVQEILEFQPLEKILEMHPHLDASLKNKIILYSPSYARKDYATTLSLHEKIKHLSSINPLSGKDHFNFVQDFFLKLKRSDFVLLKTMLKEKEDISATNCCYLLLCFLLSYDAENFSECNVLLDHALPESFSDFKKIQPLFNDYPDLTNFLIEDVTFSNQELSLSILQITIMEYIGENASYIDDFNLIPPFMIAFLPKCYNWFFQSRLSCNEKQLQALAYTLPQDFELQSLRFEFDSERFAILLNHVDPEVKRRFIEWEKNQYCRFEEKVNALLKSKQATIAHANTTKEGMRIVNPSNLLFHKIYHSQSCKQSCFYEKAVVAKQALQKIDLSKLFKPEERRDPAVSLKEYQEDFLCLANKDLLYTLGIHSNEDLKIFKFNSWKQWFSFRSKIVGLLKLYPDSQKELVQHYLTLSQSDAKDNQIQAMVDVFMFAFNERVQGLRRQLESQVKPIKIGLSTKELRKFNLRWHDFESNFNQNKAEALKTLLTYLFNLQYRHDPMLLLNRYCHQKELAETWKQFNERSFFKLTTIIERCDVHDCYKFLDLKQLFKGIIDKSTVQIAF